MTALLRPAMVLFLILTALTGIIYPLVVTGIAQTLSPRQANGSIITNDAGAAVGSSLIGQEFSAGDPKDAAKWFWGRPSATGPVAYTPLNLASGTGSTGSNLAQTNPVLLENVRARLGALAAADAVVGYVRPSDQAVPVDLVTSSGSGLDPHVSPAGAEYQVPRVALARGASEDAVRELIRAHTRGRTVGVLGEPVVNVVELNLALDRAFR